MSPSATGSESQSSRSRSDEVAERQRRSCGHTGPRCRRGTAARRLGRVAELCAIAPPDVSLVRIFLALLVCLILASLAILLVRYRLNGKAPSFLPRLSSANVRIRLLESRRISSQAEVSLIECDGAEYLLILAPGGTMLLRESKAKPASDGKR